MKSPVFTVEFPRLLRSACMILDDHFDRRRGTLGPRQIFLSLVVMAGLERGTNGRAMTELFSTMRIEIGWKGTAPSCSAMSQGRRKLSPLQCIQAFRSVRQHLCCARTFQRDDWHGYRLLSVDGTRLNLPVCPALKKEFGCPLQANGVESPCPQAGLVLLWDVQAHQPVAWTLGSYKLAERDGAMTVFSQLGPKDLVLADRGYPGLRIFYDIRQRGADFIIRMNTETVSLLKELKAFLASGATDAMVICEPVVGKRCRFPGDKPLAIRFVRDPVYPDRVLATSLLDERFTPTELWACYGQRWNIETAIREAKQWRGLEAFHAKFVDGIHQEVAALMTCLYLTSEVEAELRKRTWMRQENNTTGSTTCHFRFNHRYLGDLMRRMLTQPLSATATLSTIWDHLIDWIWRHRCRIRPGRSYPRVCKSPRGLRMRNQKTEKETVKA